jgi:aspartyl protease family protein
VVHAAEVNAFTDARFAPTVCSTDTNHPGVLDDIGRGNRDRRGWLVSWQSRAGRRRRHADDICSHLIAVDDEFATITFKGKPQKIAIGSHVNRSASGAISSIVLQANAQGHYVTQGLINGGSIKLLVDTGATLVAIPAADAIRLGIDYRQGRRGYVTTANGQAAVYQIQLDSVKIGDIELSQVDATIQETGLPFALLGMSFLSRTDMNRSGTKMTLTKRY